MHHWLGGWTNLYYIIISPRNYCSSSVLKYVDGDISNHYITVNAWDASGPENINN